MKRVVLHIDRVVLSGCARGDKQALVEGLCQGLREELARHYAQPEGASKLQRHSTLERLQAGRVTVATTAQPAAVGRQAGRGIARGLAR
jgi:hypothetical protein